MIERKECAHSEEVLFNLNPRLLMETLDQEIPRTLAHRIISISNKIHKASHHTAADTVIINPANEHLLGNEFYSRDSRMFKEKIMVELDCRCPEDVLFVINREYGEKPKVILKIGPPNGDGIPVIQIERVSECTEEEILNYKMNMRGYIEIKEEI